MKAIEFEEQTDIVANEQPQYKNLPSLVKDGLVTCCFEINEEEAEEINKEGYFYLCRQISDIRGMPAQPYIVDFDKPKLPVSPIRFDKITISVERFEANIYEWTMCIFYPVRDMGAGDKLWITTCTFGSPLQPISGTIQF